MVIRPSPSELRNDTSRSTPRLLSSRLFILLIDKRGHSNIILLCFYSPLPPCSEKYDQDPKGPRCSYNNAIGNLGACACSSQLKTEQTVNQANADDDTAKPDMSMRVKIYDLMSLPFYVVGVAEDWLKDEEDDDHNTQDGMRGVDLTLNSAEVKKQPVKVKTYICSALLDDTRSQSHP